MSLSTLYLMDARRSGCTFPYIPPDMNSDGEYRTPFMWSDNYPRPDDLPEDVEQAAIDAAEPEAIATSTVPRGLPEDDQATIESIRRHSADYLNALQACDAVVSEETTGDAITDRKRRAYRLEVSRERVRCMYNLALTLMREAATVRWAISDAKRLHEQASGVFDALLTAEYRPLSDKFEFSPDNLRVMSAINLAIALELSAYFHFKDAYLATKDCVDAAHQSGYYYHVSNRIVECSNVIPDREALLGFTAVKKNVMKGLSFYVHSLEPETDKGDSRRRKASRYFEDALTEANRGIPSDAKCVIDDINWLLGRANNFKKLLRRGEVVEGAYSVCRKRSDEACALYQPAAAPTLPPFLDIEDGQLVSPRSIRKDGSSGFATVPRVSVHVERQDLRIKPNAVQPSDTSTRYHHVEAVVTVEAPTELFGDNTVDMVVVFDCNPDTTSDREAVVEALTTVMQAAKLNKQDRVAVVQFDAEGCALDPELVAATEEELARMATVIGEMRGRGQHQGSPGTRLAQGVLKAHKLLVAKGRATDSRPQVLVVSDGRDNTSKSNFANWGDVAALRTMSPDVHVNALAIGSADSSLLRVCTGATGGDYCFVASVEGCADTIRQFLSRQVANAKLQAVFDPTVQVQCSSGVSVVSVATTRAQPAGVKDKAYRALPSAASTALPDLIMGQTSHVLLQFAVPVDLCKADKVTLATATLQYRSTGSTKSKTIKCPVVNDSWSRILDSDLNGWLKQASVEIATAAAFVFHHNSPLLLRGGETLYVGDTIYTKKRSFLSITAVDGTNFAMSESTSVELKELRNNFMHIAMADGAVSLSVPTSGSVKVVVGIYTVVVQENTVAKIICQDKGGISVNCILGVCVIATDGNTGENLVLRSPRQTAAQAPSPPVTPWELTSDLFLDWMKNKSALTDMLQSRIEVEAQQCRLLATQWIDKIVFWLHRYLNNTALRKNKASRRCRVFVVDHKLRMARHHLINSVAYAAERPDVEAIRKELDRCIDAVNPNIVLKITPSTVCGMEDNGLSIQHEKAVRTSALFVTAGQQEVLKGALDVKARERMERELAILRAQQAQRDAEQRRRLTLGAALHPAWNLDGDGYVDVREIECVFASLPHGKDCVREMLARWGTVKAAAGIHAIQLSPHQLSNILYFCTEGMPPLEFNFIHELLHERITELSDTIEESRISRTIFTLFLRLDVDHLGFIVWGPWFNGMETSWGDQPNFFNLTKSVVDTVLAEGVRLTEREDLSVQTLESLPITPVMFHKGMMAAVQCLGATSEAAAQSALAKLGEHLLNVAKQPATVAEVVRRQRKAKEKAHMAAWDLRHSFDGVQRKDIIKVTTGQWTPPDFIQEVAAPVCLLAGLTKRRAVDPNENELAVFTRMEDYWGTLKQLLRRDAEGFIQFMTTFPPMSVSFKQVRRVTAWLSQPEFEPSRLAGLSPLLSALAGWVRTMIRLAFLEHEWETDVVGEKSIMSDLVASQNRMERLTTPTPTPAPPPRTVDMDAREHHTRELKAVFDPSPVTTVSCSSPFPQVIPSPPRSLTQYRKHRQVLARRFTGITMGAGERKQTLAATPPRPSSAATGGRSLRASQSFMRRPSSAVPKPHSPPTSRPSSAVGNILGSHGMWEYVAVFEHNGYDEVEDIATLVSDTELFRALVPKPGHRDKISRIMTPASDAATMPMSRPATVPV